MDIETIYESLENGQRKQMTRQIDEYGLYDFWADFRDYLTQSGAPLSDQLDSFQDAVISYHRIKAR